MGLGEGALMGAFTTPTDADWANLEFIRDEIQAGIHERWNAFMSSAFDPASSWDITIDDGTDKQDDTIYSNWQSKLQDIAIFSWVDHTFTYAGQTSKTIFFSTFGPFPGGQSTLEQFCTVADLEYLYDEETETESIGWRRTTVHPDDEAFTAFEYGLMVPGDIIGPWIFEDLQKAMVAMQWAQYDVVNYQSATTGPRTADPAVYGQDQTGSAGTSFADAVADAEANAADITTPGMPGWLVVLDGAYNATRWFRYGFFGLSDDVPYPPDNETVSMVWDFYLWLSDDAGSTGTWNLEKSDQAYDAVPQVGPATQPGWPSPLAAYSDQLISAQFQQIAKWTFTHDSMPA